MSEKIVDTLYKHLGLKQKTRTYRRKARKAFLNFSKNKKKTKKLVRLAVKVQLNYLKQNLRSIEKLLNELNEQHVSNPLNKKLLKYYETIQLLVQQQEAMLKNSKHSCPDRIVSIH